ncbi:MAG: MBL fold metallo-hydrolase [Promethearchaeota archaeon]
MFIPRSSAIKEGKKVFGNLYYFPEIQMLDCNQYVIVDKNSDEIALFDPGNGASLKSLFDGMEKLNLNPNNIIKIYLTHEHVDHVLGVYKIMEVMKDNSPEIFAYGETAKILKEGNESKIFPGEWGIGPEMFGIKIKSLKVIDIVGLTEVQIFSEFNFQIHYTPGHSNGSISYYEPNYRILIPGDLVFTGGSFGRYDFPGGSLNKLIESIKFVKTLDVKYLLPGHMGISENGNQQIELSYRMVRSIGSFY